MSLRKDLYRTESDIDFPRISRPIFIVSILLMIVSVASLVTKGLNLSIDFEGGSIWEVPSADLTLDQTRDVLEEFDLGDGSKSQEVTDADGNRIVRIQAGTEDIDTGQSVAAKLAEVADVDRDSIAVNTVGPTWGDEITKKAVSALVWFLILIALYIAWQLEWRMSVAALISVLHDVLLTVGVYSVFAFDVTPATVISVLTILGFSLYDTIVVFDRVKENASRYGRHGNYTYRALMRRSLNQVLMRSLNTSFAALLPVVALLVIGAVVFGQPTLREFSLALFVGLILGAYSSLFVAAPVTVWLKEREDRYRQIRQRVTERGLDGDHIPVRGHTPPTRRLEPSTAPSDASDSPGSAADADASTADLVNAGAPSSKSAAQSASKAARYERAVPPRPRKQKRR